MIKSQRFYLPIITFLLGAILMYFLNLGWVVDKQNKMNKLIDNFRQTYDLQEQLRANYNDAYTELVTCTVENPRTCDYPTVNSKLEQVKIERDKLKSKLEKINKATTESMKNLNNIW